MLVEATGATNDPLSMGVGHSGSLRRGVLNRIFRRQAHRRNNGSTSGPSSCGKVSRLPVFSETPSNSHRANKNGRHYPLRPGLIGVKGVDPVNLGLEMNEEAEIYTDWANHYLEKAKFRRFIQDLQVDLADGVLLADIIEAVACEKVRDINRKPKSASQMMDNINACLGTLVQLGVSIDGLTARDIRDGNLKAILGVFFGLSRHKQHQKQQLQQDIPPQATSYNIPSPANPSQTNTNVRADASNGNQTRSTPAGRQQTNRLPTLLSVAAPQSNVTSGSNSTLRRGIPTATGNGDSRLRGPTQITSSNGEAGKGTINQGTMGNGGGSLAPSACSSRSTSPSGSNNASLIPQPTCKGQGTVGPARSSVAAVDKSKPSGGGSSFKSTKTKAQVVSGGSSNINIPTPATFNSNLQGKNSMLDKFKFFNSKDKINKVGGSRVSVSQRTSSSSGFSSARSEKSDSSPTSACSENKSMSNNSTPTTTSRANSSVSNCSTNHDMIEISGKPAASIRTVSNRSLIKTPSPSSNRKPKKMVEIKANPEDEAPVAAIHPDNPVRESRIANLSIAKVNGKVTGDKGNSASIESTRVSSVGGMQSVTVATSTTNIPKPTAAVKGTTKVLVEERKKGHQASSANDMDSSDNVQMNKKAPGGLKGGCKKADGCSQVDIRQLLTESGGGGLQPSSPLLRTCRTPSERGRQDTAIAMVSPMPCDPENGAGEPVLLPLKGGNECVANSNNGVHVNRSKVETTFDHTDKVTTRETRGRETSFSEDPEDTVVNIKPMQPFERTNPYGYVRHLSASPSHTPSSSCFNSSRAMVPNVHVSRLGFPGHYTNGGESNGGGSSHRGSGDMSGHMTDMARRSSRGYVSDGVASIADGSICSGSSSITDEFTNGYMSEGAVALGPKRPFLHTRFKEAGHSLKDGTGDQVNEYHLFSQHKLTSVNSTHYFGSDDGNSINGNLNDTIAQVNNPNLNADSSVFRSNFSDTGYSSTAQKEIARRCGTLSIEKRSSPKCKRRTANTISKADGQNEKRQPALGMLAPEVPSLHNKGLMMNKACAEGMVAAGFSGGQRPISTCSTSSSVVSSNKSGSARSNCEAKGDMQNVGGILTSIPRPDSAASCRSEANALSSLDRISNRYGLKITPESNTDAQRYLQYDIPNYGQGSLGRRLPQHFQSLSQNKDVNGSIVNSHTGFATRSTQPLHADSGSDICPNYYSYTIPHCRSPYSWLGQSLSSMNPAGIPGRSGIVGVGGSLTEAESMESLISNSSSSIHSHIQQARANSLTQTCLAQHQKNHLVSIASSSVNSRRTSSPHLTRSNSIRSTKSEKMYPSMLRRTDDIDDLSESPGQAIVNEKHRTMCRRSGLFGNGMSYPMNLLNVDDTHSTTSSPCYMTSRSPTTNPSFVGGLYKVSPGSKDDEDVHGSQLSLVSVASSLHSSPEEKYNSEIRKLRRELTDAHNKVHTLTTQLTTNGYRSLPTAQSGDIGNSALLSQHDLASVPPGSQYWQAHVVAAFEQSLSNMTNRLQTLTQTSERKDSELSELRCTVESLRKRSTEAGLISANYSLSLPASPSCNGPYENTQRHHSQTSFEGHGNGNGIHRSMNRQLSTDSMSSVNSISSSCSTASYQSSDVGSSSVKKKKKIGWLRSSFSKAFSRSRKNHNGSVSDVEDSRNRKRSDTSLPNSPLLGYSPKGAISSFTSPAILKPSHSSSALKDLTGDILDSKSQNPEVVVELKKQLREKEMVLTDVRLEALSSAHQLESLKETVNRMRSEMVNLKHDNERLQRLVTTKSLTSSQSSLHTVDPSIGETPFQRYRLSSSDMSAPANIDCMVIEGASAIEDGKRVIVSVCVGRSGSEDDSKGTTASTIEKTNASSTEVVIGVIYVSGITRWEALDAVVRKKFNDYVLRVDPTHNLGLNSESVHYYSIGEIVVTKDFVKPELLPCGYLVGDNLSIKLFLKGIGQNSVDSLAFDALIPKLNAHRLISLLNEHRRIILSGPSGTGKTYLAHKLADFLVLRSGKPLLPGSVATFQVDHRSAKELRQYLSNVAEQCEGSNASDLPSVIILDNLHHVGSLGEVFNGFLSAKHHKCPYIIGTMNHGTCSTTNLQLHHNFRWVLCHTHMEPVIGFLGRYLRRKLIDMEVQSNQKNIDLVKIIDWIPVVWQQLNKFLETHSSSDVTIGHRLFLSCPIDVAASQVWFTDLWNYSIVPYLLEAVREGLQVYGRRVPWEDPTEWVIESYPWPSSGPTSVDWPSLLRIRPEDVGYDGHPGPGSLVAKSLGSVSSELEGDPLLNMLMRLQEATSYSSPHSNDSDSMDSHESSSVHTEETSSVSSRASSRGVESTL